MRRAALAALILIVPVTLGLRSLRSDWGMIDSRRLADDAQAALAKQGWSVRASQHHLVGWMMFGARGGCRIIVHFPAVSGESDEKFRRLASAVGPVTYHYRGRVSREFPRLVPLLSWHGQRYAWSLGIPIPTAPLIAIAQSPGCSERPPDFATLRQHPQAERPSAN